MQKPTPLLTTLHSMRNKQSRAGHRVKQIPSNNTYSEDKENALLNLIHAQKIKKDLT
jgi:hypothetical protein